MGVLWVLTGTTRVAPPPRQGGGGTRAPALTYVSAFAGVVVHVVVRDRGGFCGLSSAFFLLLFSIFSCFSFFLSLFPFFSFFLFFMFFLFFFSPILCFSKFFFSFVYPFFRFFSSFFISLSLSLFSKENRAFYKMNFLTIFWGFGVYSVD